MLLGRLWRRTPAFAFADLWEVGTTADASGGAGTLSLHEPSSARLDALLLVASRRDCRQDVATAVEPDTLRRQLHRHPRGRERGVCYEGCPLYTYHFWTYLDDATGGFTGYAGMVSLRVGGGPEMGRYYGNVGYFVFPPARGRHAAARATRLVLPLARHHGLDVVSITCDPDNLASRRTIEAVGGQLVETLDVPEGHPLHAAGQFRKCHYRVATR